MQNPLYVATIMTDLTHGDGHYTYGGFLVISHSKTINDPDAKPQSYRKQQQQ